MEAIAALSFACNVLQLAETGYNVATTFRQAYKDGTTKHNLDLEFTSIRLLACLEEFDQPPPPRLQGAASRLKDAEKELYELGSKIASDARSLHKLVEPAIVDVTTSTRKKLKSGWTAFRYAGKIEDYEAKLRAHQEILNTMILVDLRKRLVLTDAQNDRYFNQLSGDMQQYINEQARLQLKEHGNTQAIVRHEAALTRTDLGAKLNAMKLENEKVAVRRRFLNSLRIPDMNKRKTDITQSHVGTLEWILEDKRLRLDNEYNEEDRVVRDAGCMVFSDDEVDEQNSIVGDNRDLNDKEDRVYDDGRWSYHNDQSDEHERFWSTLNHNKGFQATKDTGFVEWLTDSDGNYWICGSAGSGKSTLMRFLSEHNLSRSYLEQWAGPGELVTIDVYIWNAGTEFQRTYKGVLATILFQLVEQADAGNVDSLIRDKKYWNKSTITDWAVADVEEQILALFKDSGYRFCLFVDGLDELETHRRSEDDEVLLRFIDRISAFTNVKCCLSSRPEHLFETFFRNTRKLRLEHLNANDIRLLCVESLKQAFRGTQKVLNEPERRNLESFINSFVYRANGAFLWAHLVLGQMRQGIRAHDEIAELYQYLESLPSEISKLYELMWAKNNDDLPQHREEAADYINLVFLYETMIPRGSRRFDYYGINPVQLAFMFDQKFQSRGMALISKDDIVKACKRIKDRVRVRSAGLLLINDDRFASGSSSRDPYDFGINDHMSILREYGIGFIHRTAKDFLLTESVGQKIRSESSTSAGELIRRYLHALLFERCLLRRLPNSDWLDAYCTLFRTHCNLFKPLERLEILENLERMCVSTFERIICKCPGITFQQYALYSLGGGWIGSDNLVALDFNAWALRRGISSGVLDWIEHHSMQLNPEYCMYLLCMFDTSGTGDFDHNIYKLTSILLERMRFASGSATYIQCTIPYYPLQPLPCDIGSDPDHRTHRVYDYEGPGSISGVRRSVCRGLIELMIRDHTLWSHPQHFDQMVRLLSLFLDMHQSPIVDQLVIYDSYESLSVEWPGCDNDKNLFGILIDYDLREILHWYRKEGHILQTVLMDGWSVILPILSDVRWTFTVRAVMSRPHESVAPDWRKPSVEDCKLISNRLSRLPFLPAPISPHQKLDLKRHNWKRVIEEVKEVWDRSPSRGWLNILKDYEYIIPIDDIRVLRSAPPMFLDTSEDEEDCAHNDDDEETEEDEFFETAG